MLDWWWSCTILTSFPRCSKIDIWRLTFLSTLFEIFFQNPFQERWYCSFLKLKLSSILNWTVMLCYVFEKYEVLLCEINWRLTFVKLLMWVAVIVLLVTCVWWDVLARRQFLSSVLSQVFPDWRLVCMHFLFVTAILTLQHNEQAKEYYIAVVWLCRRWKNCDDSAQHC